jgi:hypothetical protein
MSASPDDAMAQCQPEPSRSSLSSTSNGPQQQSTTTAEKVDDKKPIEKTISCVSCRKRKLKCDRVKPKCGTCTRLTHECEYPERRKNPSSKRRNLKELEARLGMISLPLRRQSFLTSGKHRWRLSSLQRRAKGRLRCKYRLSLLQSPTGTILQWI